jgi:predicted RNA-binding protein with RPS1 domain
MSGEQTVGLGHTMEVDNSFIEDVEEFKYLGTKLTDQNSIQEAMKGRFKLGIACYHSV